MIVSSCPLKVSYKSLASNGVEAIAKNPLHWSSRIKLGKQSLLLLPNHFTRWHTSTNAPRHASAGSFASVLLAVDKYLQLLQIILPHRP